MCGMPYSVYLIVADNPGDCSGEADGLDISIVLNVTAVVAITRSLLLGSTAAVLSGGGAYS
jgi:hypothetical protein